VGVEGAYLDKIPVVFMGSDAIALPFLESLLAEKSLQLVGVFTQPDRATGRGMKLQSNAIAQWAKKQLIPLFQPEKLQSSDLEILKSLQCRLLLVMAYGQLLSDAFLQQPDLGALNLHASLLPALRGASPIETAIAIGAQQTGVTLMQMVKKLDAGPVLDREVVAIDEDETRLSLREKLAAACVPLFQRNVSALVQTQAVFTEQGSAGVSYCRLIGREDAYLDFRLSARVLSDRIRAFFPWPGAQFLHEGQWIKVGEAAYENVRVHDCPGRVKLMPNGFYIQTTEGCLVPKYLQRPSGKMLPVAEFLRGYSIADGAELPLIDIQPLTAAHYFKRTAV
jgi:methionyl-tRNA formyltransferase